MAMMARFKHGASAVPSASYDDEATCGERDTGPIAQAILYTKPTCSRCRVAPSCTRIRQQAVCKNCHINVMLSRIKKGLNGGPALGMDVMLAYSGGMASRSVLECLHRLMDVGRRKRPIASATSAHVDVSGLYSILCGGRYSGEFYRSRALDTVRLSLRESISCVWIPLEAAFAGEDDVFDDLHVFARAGDVPTLRIASGSEDTPVPITLPETDGAVVAAVDAAKVSMDHLQRSEWFQAARLRMLTFFSTIPSHDGRQQFLDGFIERLVVKAAKAYEIPFIYSCETADRLADRILTQVCVGNGYAVPVTSSHVDYRYSATATMHAEGTKAAVPRIQQYQNWYPAHLRSGGDGGDVSSAGIIRPLLEVETKEIAFYVHSLGLEAVSPIDFTTMSPPRSSITVATETLLSGLQSSFINTVHNVVRTAQKLKLPANAPSASGHLSTIAEDDGQHTPLCMLCGTLIPSRNTRAAVLSAQAGVLVDAAWDDTQRPHRIALDDLVCHACKLALKDVSTHSASLSEGPRGRRALQELAASLPIHTVESLQDEIDSPMPTERVSRETMKAMLGEYLLETADE